MKTHTRALLLLAVLVAAIVFILASFVPSASTHPQTLRVVFLDVGQGDAIFIESPTGRQMLIDAGPDSSVMRGLSQEMGFWDRTLDIALATHEDKDHVGGFYDVFTRYQVPVFIRTENQGESGVAHLLDELAPKEADVIYARRGDDIDLGGGAKLHILFPDRDPSFLESNTSSIVARLTYGETEFLLTGDSPDEIEEYLVLLDAAGLQSDVLKAGHHGSRTSTGELFLSVVQPTYAVISSGRDNRYGHPHVEVVDKLTSHNATILNTANEGAIAFETDGHTLARAKTGNRFWPW